MEIFEYTQEKVLYLSEIAEIFSLGEDDDEVLRHCWDSLEAQL